MANILDFLRAVLTDVDSQSAFRADPAGYVVWAGFGDLTAEDVVEGVRALEPSLPTRVGNALAPFRDGDNVPDTQPRTGESELGAAIRVLAYAVGRVAGTNGESEDLATEGVIDDPTAPPPPEAAGRVAPAPPPAAAARPPRPSTPLTPSPVPSGSTGAPPTSRTSTTARPPLAPRRPAPPPRPLSTQLPEPIAARLTSAIDEILRDTRTQIGSLIDNVSRVAAEAGAAAEARLKEVVRVTEEELGRLRDETIADRDSARHYRDEATREADTLLQSARRQTDEARTHADELLAAARAESEAVQAELTTRRAELREAERQLRERLTGIDSVFRTVLRDEGS